MARVDAKINQAAFVALLKPTIGGEQLWERPHRTADKSIA
jgi:hypothetical protein